MLDKISDFVFENVISHNQFGFVRNHSTLQQLLKYVDFLHSSLDNCQQVDSIYLDIRKALDSVSHGKVLAKLWFSGLTGSLWHFFKCYLTDRKQRVIVDGEVSRWLPVTFGVSQGSILGPLLFIIYINDLPSILQSSTPYLFANDTKYCSGVLSLNDAVFLQADLDNLSEWCQENDLSFNTSKSCLVHFCNRAKSVTPFDYSINVTSITSRDPVKTWVSSSLIFHGQNITIL